jgi:hypothetical protein
VRSVVAGANVFVSFFVERNEAQPRSRYSAPRKKARSAASSRSPSRQATTVVALATTNRYDAVATFDRKLTKKLEAFDLESSRKVSRKLSTFRQ